MFVKLTSGFLLPAQLIRNLVLQDFSVTGSKSCKLEVTFAIHHIKTKPPSENVVEHWLSSKYKMRNPTHAEQGFR